MGLVGDLPFVLVVNPSLPVTTLAELIQHARANPDQLTHASSGNGTVSHLAMEELKRLAGVQITHVPYQGSSRGPWMSWEGPSPWRWRQPLQSSRMCRAASFAPLAPARKSG